MYIPLQIIVLVATQVFGILAVVFLLSAVLTSPSTLIYSVELFHWHQVLMLLSMVYLSGSAITIYRGLNWLRKKNLKIIHASIHFSALVCAIAGVSVMFEAFGTTLNSLHSIFGLITVILFVLQWICGLLVFLYPKASLPIRELGAPHHVMLGMTIFFMGCLTAFTGIHTRSDAAGTPGVLYKFAGFAVFAFLITVVFFISRDKFKREPIPEDVDGK